MEKETRGKTKGNKNFTPSQVGTLIENFDKKLDILAENHLSVVEKLDRLSGDVEVIKEDVRFIKHDLKRKEDIVV